MERRNGVGTGTLFIDGEPAGSFETTAMFHLLISWSGLDIGRDRGSPVSQYEAPFAFTGRLIRVIVDMDGDQELDGPSAAGIAVARD
jgi:arylsulfatase